MAAVAAETRARLEERGERIRQLDDKAGDVENEAATFVELAKQLKEKQMNRKWWQ